MKEDSLANIWKGKTEFKGAGNAQNKKESYGWRDSCVVE